LNNILIIPQYALWYKTEDESDIEFIEEVDQDSVSEDDDEDEHGEREDKPNEDDDELDLFRDLDESSVSITHEEQDISNCPDIEQDPDVSFAESLCTIPDGSAPLSLLISFPLGSTF
jgi:hypothetical protein